MALWTALATGWILPSTGCQVEYAGMTLPTGRYMHDDVQYFPSGPDFPWANTQAATQRARMRAMGIEPPPPVGAEGVAPGQPLPSQIPIQQGGRPTDVNQMPRVEPVPAQPVPAGAQPLPGGVPNPTPAPPVPGGNAGPP